MLSRLAGVQQQLCEDPAAAGAEDGAGLRARCCPRCPCGTELRAVIVSHFPAALRGKCLMKELSRYSRLHLAGTQVASAFCSWFLSCLRKRLRVGFFCLW